MANVVDCPSCEDQQQAPFSGENFEVCVGTKILKFQDGVLSLLDNPTVDLPDGVYDRVVIENGCIVSATTKDLPVYTPDPCCGTEGSVNTDSLDLSGATNNLSRFVADGLLTTVSFDASNSNVIIQGTGTPSNPLILTAPASGNSQTYLQSANSAIGVVGNGSQSQPFILTHNDSPIGAGIFGRFTLDQFGHVVDYDDNDNVDLSVIGIPPVNVTETSGTFQISLQQSPAEGAFSYAGLNIVVGAGGTIQSLSADDSLPDGTFQSADGFTITVTNGVITEIV